MTSTTAPSTGARFDLTSDFGSSAVATCRECGYRTAKKGSERKAVVAIEDHFKAKHGS